MRRIAPRWWPTRCVRAWPQPIGIGVDIPPPWVGAKPPQGAWWDVFRTVILAVNQGNRRITLSRRSRNMFKVEKATDEKGKVWIQDPPIARYFFQSTATAWLWLFVRLYVGY